MFTENVNNGQPNNVETNASLASASTNGAPSPLFTPVPETNGSIASATSSAGSSAGSSSGSLSVSA